MFTLHCSLLSVWCLYASVCAGSVMFDSLQPHGLQPTRLLCPWDSPGKNTWVGCHFLPQGIFLTQGHNLCLTSPALAGGFFTTGATWEATCAVSSVKFSRSVMPDSLRHHGLQHARLPCPPTSGAYSNSCTLSQWCHPTISSSAIPFSSCLQSFLASGSFQMS